MDVLRVLALVRPFFEEREEAYALVGGMALLAHGAPRATFDLDLLAHRRTRDELVGFLEAQGFTTLSVQPGFSSHQHGEPALGRVDVVYVDGATADAVFAGCSRKAITPALEAPVPRPEHLVAMKTQSFAQDQTRYSDLADLQFLLALPGLDLAEGARLLRGSGHRRLLRSAAPRMKPHHFDLGLSQEDRRAMHEARRAPLAVDRTAALKLMTDVSPLVDAAVRRRPLLAGAPFTLPGDRESR